MDLIVTCARHYENDAGDELLGLVDALGDPDATFSKTDMSGIITAKTLLGADNAISALRARLADVPWEFRYIMRVIPVHETTKSCAADIAAVAHRLGSCIKDNDTYRITLEKRNSGESGSQIISAIADRIDRKVCLDNPDWIILVEVLGGLAGVAVIRSDGILAVSKEKMAASSQDY